MLYWINTLRPRQNRRHFADDILNCILFNENVWIPIQISLNFVPQGPINNTSASVQIMAWRRPGDKPLSGPMMVRLPTPICVTRPQWVKCEYINITLNTYQIDGHESPNPHQNTHSTMLQSKTYFVNNATECNWITHIISIMMHSLAV